MIFQGLLYSSLIPLLLTTVFSLSQVAPLTCHMLWYSHSAFAYFYLLDCSLVPKLCYMTQSSAHFCSGEGRAMWKPIVSLGV